ncbi:UPF0147 family protein [Candidatus Woesearchaeota archaeon]|jgi:uncharacterized protein (UPF0147 family)|nr:UPF0147 family protein [Candidatus Woesearchaeota archaeon]
MDERVQNIIEALEELTNDNTVPRNIKSKVDEVIGILKEDNGQDMSIKVNKALSELDEISDDTNIQAYTRTQIWNIASMLETI